MPAASRCRCSAANQRCRRECIDRLGDPTGPSGTTSRVGLPLTILLGFVFAAIVFPSLDILEMALLAAILAPTDAALGKPVVTNLTVSPVMRDALNLESGLNDGICVPIVVILLGPAVGTKIEGGTAGHVLWVVVEDREWADRRSRT